MSGWSTRLTEKVSNALSGLAETPVIGGEIQTDSVRFDFADKPNINERDFSSDTGYPSRVQGHSLFVYKYDNDPRISR